MKSSVWKKIESAVVKQIRGWRHSGFSVD